MDFFNANHQPSQVSSRRAQVSWSLPMKLVYKGNFDAAFFDTTGCTGVGVVFRNFQGQVIAALSQKIPFGLISGAGKGYGCSSDTVICQRANFV